jgi:hypothetical protein
MSVTKEYFAQTLKAVADVLSSTEEGPTQMKAALTDAVKDADDKKKKLLEVSKHSA